MWNWEVSIQTIYLHQHEGTPIGPQLWFWQSKNQTSVVANWKTFLKSYFHHLWAPQLVFDFIDFGVNIRSVGFIRITLQNEGNLKQLNSNDFSKENRTFKPLSFMPCRVCNALVDSLIFLASWATRDAYCFPLWINPGPAPWACSTCLLFSINRKISNEKSKIFWDDLRRHLWFVETIIDFKR